MRRALVLVAVCACHSPDAAAPAHVDLAPADAGSQPEAAPPLDGLGRLAAAERLAQAGRYEDARAAFEAILPLYPYSKVAATAELRIAEIDDTLGRHVQSKNELRAWVDNHRYDARRDDVWRRATSLGGVCVTDADCTVTTRIECCDACPSGPYAASRAWLDARDGKCSKTQCERLAKKCAPPPEGTAVCQGGACVLTKK